MSSGAERVAIAGAGIGGLSAALALSRAGIGADVFERRPEPSETGAGIQLGPNASKVLASLGVLEAVRAMSAEPDGLTVHDGRSGRVLARFPLGRWLADRHSAPYLTLHRQDLHRVLFEAADAADGVSVRTGVAVTDVSQDGGSVAVELSDEGTHGYPALVAADGLWSRLRPLISGCDRPVPLGKCAYRAVVAPGALPASLASNDVHIWLAAAAHAVHYPVRRGEEIAVIVVVDGVASEESWALRASRAALLSSPAGRFSDSILRLIYATEKWRMWPLQSLAPLERWSKGAAALLGDAAHPIAPFFAQGGALAIEDAAVLAQVLSRTGPAGAAEAFQVYERLRKPRADRVVRASRRNGEIFHARGIVGAARNAVLATMPGAAMMRRYDWLYGWSV